MTPLHVQQGAAGISPARDKPCRVRLHLWGWGPVRAKKKDMGHHRGCPLLHTWSCPPPAKGWRSIKMEIELPQAQGLCFLTQCPTGHISRLPPLTCELLLNRGRFPDPWGFAFVNAAAAPFLPQKGRGRRRGESHRWHGEVQGTMLPKWSVLRFGAAAHAQGLEACMDHVPHFRLSRARREELVCLCK